MQSLKRSVAVLFVGASLSAMACPALAQSAPDVRASDPNAGPPAGAPTAPAPASADTGEIVVQAQRISQSLQQVPIAVTVKSGQQLEEARLHDLSQLTLALPSLEVTSDNAFVLRGVGSQIFSSNVDSSVGVTVDEVSLGVPIYMSNAAFVDVRQVEALTGPQGLLFGRNSSAGLINVITQRPQLNALGGEINVEYDGRDAPGGHFGIVATGIANIPTSSNSALRLNILESDQDPVVKAIVNTSPNYQGNQKRLQGKAKWLWEPTSDLSIYLIGDYSRERGVGGIWDDTFRSTGLPNPPGQDAGNAAKDGLTPGPKNLDRALDGEEYRSVNTGGISANVSYKLAPDLTISNIFAWRHYTLNYNLDADNSSTNGANVNFGHQSYNQYSEELRLAYVGDRLTAQAGFYGFWSTLNGHQEFLGAGGLAFLGITNFVQGINDYDIKGRSLAGYGQAQYRLTDKLQLIAGARVTNDHVSANASADNYPIVPVNPPIFGFLNQLPFVNTFGPAQAYDDHNHHTNFSYKAGAQYNFTSRIMLYATWATGYKGPAEKTFIVAAGEDPYLKPETVKSLETGIKTQLFDNRLRLNVAGFISKFKNFQVQGFTGQGLATLTNAEGVKTSGVEVDADLRVTPAFRLTYNATLQDSYFTKFSFDPCYTGQSAATCTNGAYFQGAGIKTPASARYHSTLGAIYTVPVGNAKLDFQADWYHRSKINYSAAGAPYTVQNTINVFGGSINYRTTKGINLSVFCKNCGNKIYPNFILTDPLDAAGGIVSTINRFGYNSVRTIGAAIGYRF